ncbi:MAG TPA: hypothetical protein VII76_05665 [Acidimicrobiales bacterium]
MSDDRELHRQALQLGDLLTHQGVLDLVNSYSGPREPTRLAEAASAAGIRGLEAADYELLVTAIPAEGGQIGRWLGIGETP